MSVKRFIRSPKGQLIGVMTVLTAVAMASSGFRPTGIAVASGALAAMLLDAPILRLREGKWVFPDGALLTGLFVAGILSPHEPWHVVAITSMVAIASKHVLRVGRANAFNPAALALVATFYWFDTGQSWWGALPEAPLWTIALLIAGGIYITRLVNKSAAVLSFLGVYYALFTITAFLGDPGKVSELYRAPDLHAALFYAFFMVTDPPTSPPKPRDQYWFGAIAAIVSYAAFELIGAAYFLLAGLLVANGWEAGRRILAKRAVEARRATATSSRGTQ